MVHQLPEAILGEQGFGRSFLTNNQDPGFTSISGFDGIRSEDGRNIEELRDSVYDHLRIFSELPEKEKRNFHDPKLNGQRGYVPNQVEQSGSRPEFREHIMLAKDLPHGHPSRQYEPLFFMNNTSISEGLDHDSQQLLGCLEELAGEMFEEVAIQCGAWWGEFAAPLVDAENFLRLHTYPATEIIEGSARTLDDVTAIGGDSVSGVEVVDICYVNPTSGEERLLLGAMRAAPHPDVGFYTLLLGAEEPGLYIKTAKGGSMPFTTAKGKIVGNTADDAEVLIPGAKSRTHWVGLNTETVKRPRYSIANFIHRRPKTLVGTEFAGVRLYRRLHEIEYIKDKDAADFLMTSASELQPGDSQLIGEILMWSKNEKEAGRPGSRMNKYYHLVNGKTGKYEKIMERAA